ncbi:MAG TPA: AAA family ATPase [Rectinemataceae bacterium]|nr:AAA family ATPase [Rectinemataceae bacterium]
MKVSQEVQAIFNAAYNEAKLRNHEYLTPEHILYASLSFEEVRQILAACEADVDGLRRGMEAYFEQKIPQVKNTEPVQTAGFQSVIERAVIQSQAAGKEEVEVADILVSLFDEERNYSAYYLRKAGVKRLQLLEVISHGSDAEAEGWEDEEEGEEEEESREEHEDRKPRAGGRVAALDRFATDLTKLAKEGKLEPVIGREAEIERTVQVLCRRLKNNPIHVGDAGVGKTAITEGLAQRIVAGTVPPRLLGYTIYGLDMGALLAGTKFRGDFEERVKRVVDELLKKDKAILFIDEIHTIIGAGAVSGGSMDASNLLKPALTSGKLRCIGSTTFDEYNKYFEKDRALSRRFQKIDIVEPTQAEALDILRGLRTKYEEYHRVHYSDEALDLAVSLSAQYITERRLPDKAIDVIDEAGAWARINAFKNAEAERLSAEAEAKKRAEEEAAEAGSAVAAPEGAPEGAQMERASESLDAEKAKGKELEESKAEEGGMRKGAQRQAEMASASSNLFDISSEGSVDTKDRPTNEGEGKTEARQFEEALLDIGRREIEIVVAKIARIPERSVSTSEKDKLASLENELKHEVFGQDAAVEAVVKAVKRSRAGFRSADKPVANFLFVGPTGVGKTELARQLAKSLGVSLHRFDMSEYQEKHTVSRLIGSPPGYVGYEEGGLLTDAIRKTPHAVVLLDEIEKAHPDVYNILLQIMDYATLTDNQGRKADFRNVVLIMTSNAGARDIGKNLIGFGERTVTNAALNEAVERAFTPEFRNRLDAVVHFENLPKTVIERIVEKAVDEFRAQLSEKKVALVTTPALVTWLAEKGYSKEFGARNISRLVEDKIKTWFVDQVLFGTLTEGGTAIADIKDGEVSIEVG